MLHITQFGIEVDNGFLMSITLDPAHAFASCDWDGKTTEPIPNLHIIKPIGNGFISAKYPTPNPLINTENSTWLPFANDDSELAFTGQKMLVNELYYGKIYW